MKNNEKIPQLDLTTKITGLNKNLAYLSVSTDNMKKRTGIEFTRAVDDLDFYDGAIVAPTDRTPFTLICYPRSETGGIIVETFDSIEDYTADLVDIMRRLQLRVSDLSWVADEVDRDFLLDM